MEILTFEDFLSEQKDNGIPERYTKKGFTKVGTKKKRLKEQNINGKFLPKRVINIKSFRVVL